MLQKQGKTDEIFLNRPKIRFDITVKFESERRAEQNQTQKHINENREHLIDAAIVRVMKMRKICKYQSLIAEVLSQLTSKFTPKVPQIKVKLNFYHHLIFLFTFYSCFVQKCIEKLIEKEYLERDTEDRDTYKYIS